MSSAADRRRAREEYYRGSSSPAVEGSSHHDGSVLSHVSEGTTETSSRNTNNNEPPDEEERARGRGGDPSDREESQRHYFDNQCQSDSPGDDEDDELRTLATMDTTTFRRLREQRRKQSSKERDNSTDRRNLPTATTARRHGSNGNVNRSSRDNHGIGSNSQSRRVRYRGHGRTSFGGDDDNEEDYDDYSHDTRTTMSDMASRFSRYTHRSHSNNDINNRRHHSSSYNQPWQIYLLFALGFVLILKAGIVEIKLEKSQLRGVGRDSSGSSSTGGGDAYSHLNHLQGEGYYNPLTLVNSIDGSSRSLGREEKEEKVYESDGSVTKEEEIDSPSEAYFKEAVVKLENGGGGVDVLEEKMDVEEEVDVKQLANRDVGRDNISNQNEKDSFGDENNSQFSRNRQQEQRQQDLQQLLEQSEVQSLLAGKSPMEQKLLIEQFQGFLNGKKEQQQEEQPKVVGQEQKQQSLFDQQLQNQMHFEEQFQQFLDWKSQQQSRLQFQDQQNLLGQQQQQLQQSSLKHYQYGQPQVNQQQQGYQQYGQLQNQFGQRQPQQLVQQDYGQQQQVQQHYGPQQQVQQHYGQQPQVQQNYGQNQQEYGQVQQQLFQQQYGQRQQVQKQYIQPQHPPLQPFEPQLRQDVQQEVFDLQLNDEVAGQPDQLFGNAYPDYSPVFNANDVIDNDAAQSNEFVKAQVDTEIGRNLVDENAPSLPPTVDMLNHHSVPFDLSRQPRYQGYKQVDDVPEDTNEDVRDELIQVQSEVYGTLKEVQPIEKKPIESQTDPDLNFKAKVVDDGIGFTNPRLWGSRTLTTPQLRSFLEKNDAKFAPSGV